MASVIRRALLVVVWQLGVEPRLGVDVYVVRALATLLFAHCVPAYMAFVLMLMWYAPKQVAIDSNIRTTLNLASYQHSF